MHIDLALVADTDADTEFVRRSLSGLTLDAFVVQRLGSLKEFITTLSSEQPPDVALLVLNHDDTTSHQAIEGVRTEFPEIALVVMKRRNPLPRSCDRDTVDASDYLVTDEFNANDLARSLRLAMTRQRHCNKRFSLANYDDVTGLANRYLFRDRLSHAIGKVGESAETVALLLLDIDGFKQVNREHGRETGDRFLRVFGEALVAKLDDSDTVARLGNDEFAIILENLKYPQAALEIATNLLSMSQRPITIGTERIQTALNIGVAFHTENREGATRSLLEGASAALENAKRNGKNQLYAHTEPLNRELAIRIERDNDLQAALSKNEFRVYYQPIVDTSTRQLIAYEALLRWQEENKKGVTLPAKFLENLVRIGQMRDVGEFVLRSAIERHAEWMRQCSSPVSLCVNVCASQISDSGFAKVVKSALEEFELAPNLLSLELTEDLLINDSPKTRRIFSELTELGVRFSIDDFGIGHNSYSYLKIFPISTLKIDRSFTRLLHVDHIDRAIARSQINLARELGLQVIAEGVENHIVLNELEVLRPDGLQGFLIGRPMPANRFEQNFIQPLMALPECALAI